MEESWLSRIRSIMKTEQSSVVDAKIDDGNHILLKTRDGRSIDAGEIKEQTAADLIYVVTPGTTDTNEPSIYASKDGAIWSPAQVEGKLKDPNVPNKRRICWTGDRFLLSIGEDRQPASLLNGVCVGALSNVQLFSTLPASTRRPKVLLFPATATINTEWVVVYAPQTNPTTGGYEIWLRYASCAGDVIQLGPTLTIPGGGWGGLDGTPGLYGLWNDGISIIVGHIFNSWVITSPGSLTTPPTVSANQSSRGYGQFVAQCSGGAYVWSWTGAGTQVQRRPISGGVIGDIDYVGVPPGFTNFGNIIGPLGGPYFNVHGDSSHAWYQPVNIDRAANNLVFGANPSSFTVPRTILSAVHQTHQPVGSQWLLTSVDLIFHLTDAGEVLNVASIFGGVLLDRESDYFVSTNSGGTWGLVKSNSDGSISSYTVTGCSTPQEYTFSRDAFSYGIPKPKRILYAVGKRLILAGPISCLGCLPTPQPGRSLLQSKDGGNWTHHPDKISFNIDDQSMGINAMAATGTGLVVAVGTKFGLDRASDVAVSHDFGDTWNVMSSDPALFVLARKTLFGIFIKNDFEWVIFENGNIAWYTFDGGGHWSRIVFPVGFSPNTFFYGNGITYFNDWWWAFGTGSGNGQWDTPLIRSKNLVDWEPVVTPWSGTYPPMQTYLGHAHNSNSGNIYTLEHDSSTNTVMITGFSPFRGLPSINNWPQIMLSTDGGEHFFEIGKEMCGYFTTSYGWEGIYNLPNALKFQPALMGSKFASGKWFVINSFNQNLLIDSLMPQIVVFSPDGKHHEPVFLPQQIRKHSFLLGVKN